MTHDARIRIDNHRLMRNASPPLSDAPPTTTLPTRIQEADAVQKRFMRRVWVHAGAFVAAIVSAAGIFLIGTLLAVHSSEDIAPVVFISILAAGVFVATFTLVRMVVLHLLTDDYPDKEEDPGIHHHLAKSITYGFVALALALLCIGLMLKRVSAELLFASSF